MAIDSYEKFCKAFTIDQSEPEFQQAKLLLFLQDWMATAAGWADAESGDYGLDMFLDQIADRPAAIAQRKDVVSRLIDGTDMAVRRIAENMRSTIIQENVLQPVYKVREINSYGLNWLSRRPGRTAKEKIANSNGSMMAVKRRQSVDTGENRLFLAFLREMVDLVDMKASSHSADRIRSEEMEFASKAFWILKDPNLSEVRRWENLPPNNTLLSDQNYSKIWRNWNELKEIDEIIAEDAESLDRRLAAIFFMLLLSQGKKYFAFPQIPLVLDYRSRRLQLCAPYFYGVDASGETVEANLRNSSMVLKYHGREVVVAFKDDKFALAGPDNDIRMFPVEPDSFVKYAKMAIGKLGCSRTLMGRQNGSGEPVKCGKIVVDLFQIRPRYAADEGGLQELDGRILFQRHLYTLEDEDEPTVFLLPCNQACAIEIADNIETYSVVSAVEDAQLGQLADLSRLIGKHIRSRRLTFLFPDAYNEFQVSMVHKALRLAFSEVVSFPRSMGAVFSLMRSPRFSDTITCGDFLLVLDLSYDDLSFTLVQSSYDDRLARDIPEFGGLIWERHPTTTESLSDEIKAMTNKLLEHGCLEAKYLYKLLGTQGFASEAGRLSILFDENSAFTLSDDTTLSQWRIPIGRRVTHYLDQHRQIIGNARVHIVSLSSALYYKGMESFRTIPYDDAIRGYQFFESLQDRTAHMLWKEHLPELAIKLLYGKFNLVENQTVQPAFNMERKIPIVRRFTLAKGKNEYRFVLVSHDLNRKTQYAAVVRNPAFPLAQDTVCHLDMTYRYGAEEPYRLIFIPESPEAGFAEAKVSWEPAGEYPYMDLPFPEPLMPLTWDELSNFNGRNGVEDLLDGDRGIVKYFRQVAEEYKTINLDDYQYSMQGIVGKRRFVLDMVDSGRPIKVTFSETQMEQSKNRAVMNFDNLHTISFQLEADRFVRQRVRYRTNLKDIAHYGDVWFLDKGGKHYCIRDLTLDGRMVSVAFFENMFLPGESFSSRISNISFEVDMSKESMHGRYRAENIHDEDKGPYQQERAYFAKRIRRGDVPPSYLYNRRAAFLFHTVFGAGNSATQTDAPPILTAAFEGAKESWLRTYQRCGNSQIGGAIFALMSLCAADLGAPYYIIANAKLDDLMEHPGLPLPDNMGYALGACTSDEECALLRRVLCLGEQKPLRTIRLLSKAVWGHPDFIMNVDKSWLLDYFDIAAENLKWMCSEKRFGQRYRKKITACLEYILAVYRLRSSDDENLNRYLSCNKPIILELYHTLEVLVDAIIDGSLEIRSFLRLDVPDKGIYRDVPDLLYALLVYVTGDDGAGDIRITGLSLDDIEM